MNTDLAGERPRWAGFVQGPTPSGSSDAGLGVAVDLGSTDTRGRSGVVWSLPHGGDLDVNFVHLRPTDSIGPHVNNEVDVVITVFAGSGLMSINGTRHDLRSEVLVVVPKGTRREISPAPKASPTSASIDNANPSASASARTVR